jgi:hypothetical protein
MFNILKGILLIFNKILTFQNWLFIHIGLVLSQIDQILKKFKIGDVCHGIYTYITKFLLQKLSLEQNVLQ